MKLIQAVLLFTMIVTAVACSPEAVLQVPSPVSTVLVEPPATQTSMPEVIPTATTAVENASNVYSNADFGLGFNYPPGWFGPDETISGDTLRVVVGSDKVYPYGTGREEQVYTIPNSFYITVQYTRNNQNDFWKETYSKITAMQDGEEMSDGRSKLIRIRQLNLGRFQGVEYIATLSDQAQTEPVYMREVILVDDQGNLLTVSGSPNMVDTSSGDRRLAYKRVDNANVDQFHRLLESITVQ